MTQGLKYPMAGCFLYGGAYHNHHSGGIHRDKSATALAGAVALEAALDLPDGLAAGAFHEGHGVNFGGLNTGGLNDGAPPPRFFSS